MNASWHFRVAAVLGLVMTATGAAAAPDAALQSTVSPGATGCGIALLCDGVWGGKKEENVTFATAGGKEQEDVVFGGKRETEVEFSGPGGKDEGEVEFSSTAEPVILFGLDFGGDGLLRADGEIVAAFAPGAKHEVRIDLLASDGVWYAHARVVRVDTGALVAVVTRSLDAAPAGAAAWGSEVLSLAAE